MARQLWLLRHGDAEPPDARADADRRLTPKGSEQARAAGLALARLQVSFDAIFSSPRVRAHATATGVAQALGADVVVHEPLSEGFDADDARTLVAAADADGGKVLVVGHEPDFSAVTHELTGARMHFKKGGIAVVRIDGSASSRGELVALLRPRELAAIART